MDYVNPGIAFRDCDFCQKFLHDEDRGVAITNPAGEPFPRPLGNVPPCRMRGHGTGCDKGTPEHNLNHTPENRQAYQHYKECKAVGVFPDDPIVRRNAAILMEAEEACRREDWTKFRVSALQILTGALSM